MSKGETVLVISDLQIPFQHQDAFDFLKEAKKKYKPTQVVCIGDEVDMHALSDYEHDPDGFSAGHEMAKAVDELQPYYKLFPDVKSVTSNHTSRPLRRAFKYGIPKAFLKSYKEFMEAPQGWEWRDYWVMDGVRYEHGDALTGGAASVLNSACIQNQRSTVFGHFHAGAGIKYVASTESLMFSMNVGCLIDRHSYAFQYGAAMKTKGVLGLGIVERAIPTFVPMLLERGGRWIGEFIG
jgi:hypothetical protein